MLIMLNNLYEAINLTSVQFLPLQNIRMSPALTQKIKITNKPKNVTNILAEEHGDVQSEPAPKQISMNVQAKMYGSVVQRYNDNTRRANEVLNFF